MSILGRVYGSDVFFSVYDERTEWKKLGEFLSTPRDKLLYSEIERIRNMFLIDSRVRQPLLNGFEFNTFMDSSLSLYTDKDSTKTDQDSSRNFQINNLYR